jgi:hypothetical protein
VKNAAPRPGRVNFDTAYSMLGSTRSGGL